MVTAVLPLIQKAEARTLNGLQHSVHAAKMAIDEELGRATDMDFRMRLVLTANSLRNLEEQILRRS
jgi:hypothetical protein